MQAEGCKGHQRKADRGERQLESTLEIGDSFGLVVAQQFLDGLFRKEDVLQVVIPILQGGVFESLMTLYKTSCSSGTSCARTSSEEACMDCGPVAATSSPWVSAMSTLWDIERPSSAESKTEPAATSSSVASVGSVIVVQDVQQALANEELA